MLKSQMIKKHIHKTWFLFVFPSIIICLFLFEFSKLSIYAADASKEEESLFVAKKAFEDGFYEVSLGLLDRFLNNYPDSKNAAQAGLLRGQCYFYQNKSLEALDIFNKLQGLDSAKNIRDAVVYWIAEVYFRNNNFNKAAESYRKIISDFPKSTYSAVSLYSLGWCLFQEHEFRQASEYFKAVEEKFPQEPYAQDSSFKIIECLYNLKEYSVLKDKLKIYLKIYSHDSVKVSYLNFYTAEADYYLNNLLKAAEEYTQLISSSTDKKIKALCRLGAGWAYLKLKRYKQAEANFLEARFENLDNVNQGILLLGMALLKSESKSLSEAKNIYKKLINTVSDQNIRMQAYLGYADALYNLAEYKESANIYKQALAEVRASVSQDIIDKLHYGMAWAFLKRGEFKEAIEEFQKIAKASEDKIVKISALCQVGDAYQDSGDFNKAFENYDFILKNYPDSSYGDYVQYQLGLVLFKVSKYDEAIKAFKSLKLNFPESKLLDDAMYALGLVYSQQQDYNSSKEICEKFQDKFPDSSLKPQALYLLGASLYNLGRFSQAIEVFKNIIRLYDQDTELLQKCGYEIADCFYRLGNEKEAVERFKMLRMKYPDSKLSQEVIWWLGEYYYKNNAMDLARDYFLSLIKEFPKSNLIPDAYYALGVSFAEESNCEQAVINFKKVMGLSKSELRGNAGIAIADIYLKQGKLDLALNAYKEMLGNDNNLARLIYPKIGEVYYKLNNFSEAIVSYKKCLDLVPVKQMGDIQFRIAETMQAQGKIQDAIEEYLKVPCLYPEENSLVVISLLRVASMYEDKEDFKGALNIYEKVVLMGVEESKYAKERIDWIKGNLK